MFQLDTQLVLAIAREAVSRNGLVSYSDYNRYLRGLIRHRQLDPIDAGWSLWSIKRILLDENNPPADRYFYGKIGNKACFYPLAGHLFAGKGVEKAKQLLSAD